MVAFAGANTKNWYKFTKKWLRCAQNGMLPRMMSDSYQKDVLPFQQEEAEGRELWSCDEVYFFLGVAF
jgi:hypothetical protein